MKSDAFSTPQRQSIVGIGLIFLSLLYRFLKGFWVLGVYLLLSSPGGLTMLVIGLALGSFALLVLIYSFLYYQNFLFHINYSREEFILQKGVIATENLAIPFDKIQQVYSKRSILQRIAGVSSVVIDTAGSKESEVSIDAISTEDALSLSSILTAVKKEQKEFDAEQAGDEVLEESTKSKEEEVWTHKLDFLTLLKIGISTNYLRGLALILAFFSSLYNESRSFLEEEEISAYMENIPVPSSSVLLFSVLLILLLFTSIFITLVEVFLKYFGLKLQQTRDSLVLEMGLDTNTKVSLQPRRVQLAQIITNPVQKRFNLHEARISLASSQNELQKNRIKIPGLDSSTVEKVKLFLFGSEESRFSEEFRPHRLLLQRKLFLAFLPVIISGILLIWWDYISLNLWIIFAILYSGVAFVYQLLYFRSLRLIFTEDFLQKKKGVWTKTEENFEIYKMQSVSVSQPFWYERRNLVNVVFHTAGGDMTFLAVDKTILPYVNYVLYKTESTHRPWM